jgi:hypothetical protein
MERTWRDLVLPVIMWLVLAAWAVPCLLPIWV